MRLKLVPISLCTDNAAMIALRRALHRADPVPGLPRSRRFVPHDCELVLYARPGCHLCDEARAGLEALLADGARFELEEVDIESDDALHRRATWSASR